jgi:hypothetical protein
MRILVLATLLILGAPGTLPAQRLDGSPFPSIDQAQQAVPQQAIEVRAPRPTDTGRLIGGGLLAGATGGLAGMYSGALLTANACEDCAIIGGIYGLAAGVSGGIPLGVHLSNGGRGKLVPSLLASVAIGGAGLGLAIAADEPAVLLAVPVLQLAAAIGIERRTGRDVQETPI